MNLWSGSQLFLSNLKSYFNSHSSDFTYPFGSIEEKREMKSYPAGRFLCFVGDDEKGSDEVHGDFNHCHCKVQIDNTLLLTRWWFQLLFSPLLEELIHFH